MISLLLYVKNTVRSSSIVAPSKPLQGYSVHAPSSVVRPGKSSWNGNHTAQVVTGLDLVPLTDGIDVNLQHPDYADERTRLQSFKHWCGIIPATELSDAGLYMVARDTVRCYSCHVVIQGWKKGNRPIDMRCLCSGDCYFVKNYMQRKSEIGDVYMASCMPKSSTTKWTGDDMDAPLSEKMIISNRRLYEEEYCVNDMRDNKPRIVAGMCKLCQDNKVDCVLLPCGDAKTCTSCATMLFNSGQPCYFCNQTVATVHPIYL